MRNLIKWVLALLFLNTINGQGLEYKEFTKADKGSKYRSYISKDSVQYKIGEYVKIGNPSSNTFKYITIFQGLGYLPMSISENHLLDESCKIMAISVTGSKKKGFFAYIQVNSKDGTFFSIEIEKAIEVGEVLSNQLSEDEALELLKKAKDKLDLEIISQEEYDKIKKELMKYFK